MTNFDFLKSFSDIKGEEYAIEMINLTARGTPQRSARMAMANAAAGKFGNYTDAAKALWAEYAKNGAPSWREMA